MSNETKVNLPIKCMHCGTTHNLEVKQADLLKYNTGAHVQNCFPYLNADQRELIISRTCGKCFDKMFGEE